MVEFVREDSEVAQDPADIQRVERLLIEAQAKQDKEKSDGSESPAASPEPPDGS
jgi:hypothetical protein